MRFLLPFLALASAALAFDDYKLGPDSQPQEGTPKGEVAKHTFETSKIYPGSTRDYWVYVPKEYDAAKPACLMVFLDGGGFVKPDGQFRVPVVFDNLIAKKEMPVTVGVFVNPGVVKAVEPGQSDRSNRSYEYDSLGEAHAKFLLEELLPEALKGLNITTDPAGRAICGNSSGGICAFTVAWERPEAFGKVVSHIGSFTNIRGGFAYPALIRGTKAAPKPIRVFLQDGSHDLDNLHGDWPLSSQDMAAALKFAGYDYQFVFGDGGHSGKQGGAILPDTLRWLWRDYGKQKEPADPAIAIPPHPTDPWKLHPDAVEQPNVPKGTVTQMPPWESKIYPGTVRDWWVYVPAQYKPDGSAAVMVFQDGRGYVDLKGNWRVPTGFDNLIARGDMPVTVAICVNPGNAIGAVSDKPGGKPKPGNRSNEYDSLGDKFARYLIEEILPEVEKKWPLSHDPELHAISGSSSGGICSFTVAWERPEVFHKVLSTVGSFTNIRGGNAYPSLIRKTEHKPLRVFLEDASGDLDNEFGNWPLANKQMDAALRYMNYDVRFDFAEGYRHSSEHGGSIFPDALKWLWRDWQKK